MYRIIEDSFWDDPAIAALSKDEKIVTVCLFTNVHTRPCGIYRIGIDRIAAMTKVVASAVPKILRRIEEDDIAYYDGKEVCIPGYIRKQRYKGPLIAKRVVSELAQVKNRAFVEKIVKRYPDFLKLGGYKPRHDEDDTPRDPVADAAAKVLHDMARDVEKERKKGKREEIAELAEEIATKLKFTGGVRKPVLEELARREPAGIAGVRAAVARAAKYYETAKAEKWKMFVIARRFSKFCEFYGEAFSSDEAAAAYIERIRSANEREFRKLRKETASTVGAQRPEPDLPEVDPWGAFLYRFPPALESIRVYLEAYRDKKVSATVVEGKLLELLTNDAEFLCKEDRFLKTIGKPLRTPETIRRYRLNYIKGKYGVPDLEEGR